MERRSNTWKVHLPRVTPGATGRRLSMDIEGIRGLPPSRILIRRNYLEDLYLPEIQRETFPPAREHGIDITARMGPGHAHPECGPDRMPVRHRRCAQGTPGPGETSRRIPCVSVLSPADDKRIRRETGL